MKNWIPTLQKILNKARISPWLHQAIMETIKALKNKDLALAFQLSGCKSFITGILNPKNRADAFQEDREYNITLNKGKESVYYLMDSIHFDLSMELGILPSGMMIVSSGPQGLTATERTPIGKHPVVKRIILERNRGYKEAMKRFPPTKRKS